jgi:hypothetical protein
MLAAQITFGTLGPKRISIARGTNGSTGNLPLRACVGVALEGDDLVELVATAAVQTWRRPLTTGRDHDPFSDNQLILGTGQQVVILEFDTRPRRRNDARV